MALKLSNALIILYFTLLSLVLVDADFGILYAKNNVNTSERFCISYNTNFSKLPEDLRNATFFPLISLIPGNGCNFTILPFLEDKIIMVDRGGCSLAQKALNVQTEGGKALIVSYPHLGLPVANDSDYHDINITVAIIEDIDALKLKNMAPDVEIAFYAPHLSFRLDYSIIIVWLIAMFVVTVGGLWSGYFKHQLYEAQQSSTKLTSDHTSLKQNNAIIESTSLNIGPMFVIIFVLMMCVMLLLLYFFFDYIVYIIIAMFCIASSFSLFYCLGALVRKFNCNARYRISITWPRILSLDIILLLIFMASLAFGICWAIYRNHSFAWILQDILGVAFCIHALKMIRLPNLKVCVALLVLLLIYDIFFVFITPLFTKSGESIMVEVATGSNSQSTEQLPVVLRVPHFKDDSVCHFGYSLLGFGDLLIPGLLIAYCHSFDLKVNRKVYFISTVIAYGIGLIITFVALAVMQEGQPALLYLVPCTLITVVIVGWKKHDLKHLWTGELPYDEALSNINSILPGEDVRVSSEVLPTEDKEQLIY